MKYHEKKKKKNYGRPSLTCSSYLNWHSRPAEKSKMIYAVIKTVKTVGSSHKQSREGMKKLWDIPYVDTSGGTS